MRFLCLLRKSKWTRSILHFAFHQNWIHCQALWCVFSFLSVCYFERRHKWTPKAKHTHEKQLIFSLVCSHVKWCSKKGTRSTWANTCVSLCIEYLCSIETMYCCYGNSNAAHITIYVWVPFLFSERKGYSKLFAFDLNEHFLCNQSVK